MAPRVRARVPCRLIDLATAAAPGNVTAQIEYTKYSTRWKYPDQWYSVRQSFPDGKGGQVTFELHLIDTVIISGKPLLALAPAPLSCARLRPPSPCDAAGNTDLNEDPFAPPPGAADPVLAETQWQWVEDQLANSTVGAASRAPLPSPR